ncbi:cupin domain-containing protein [Paenibacillus sp. UNC499MF]|uniref:cupin domain-containing protein n=1 Tax=Paenibacillus sp. UNC499MF TaxID=1502751 RepID=UPI00089F9F54|nr:cupin domain-containing protein [Paenibacillus sp. UNC499MF]SEF81817.1 Cupin domain-containing protein [Paenibacillus sp. UNC499MF]
MNPTPQNLLELTRNIQERHVNFAVSDVNSHVLRIAVMTGNYRWHFHPDSDELFMVLEGELFIDFEDGTTTSLKANDTLTVPAGTVHRTRADVRTVNLCFEAKEAETVFVDEPAGRDK